MDRQLLHPLGRMTCVHTAVLALVLGAPSATVHRSLTGLLPNGIVGCVMHSSQRYYPTANGIGEAAGVIGFETPSNFVRAYPVSREWLALLIRRMDVESTIRELEAQNEGGDDGAPARLPKKLANQKALRQRVRQAMEDLPERERPSRYKRPTRINLTDKDARLMQTRQGVVPGYNAQAMVSPLTEKGGTSGMLVTAVDVVDEANDTARLTPMVEQAEEVTGVRGSDDVGRRWLFRRQARRGVPPKGPSGGHAGHGPAYKPPVPQGPVQLR